METTAPILTTRRHAYLKARDEQLARNILVLDGGQPYIDARLSRHPGESDASWIGDSDRGVIPRRKRAFMVNYAGRVAGKIDQYVFQTAPTRAGAAPWFVQDASKTGLGVDAFMARVNSLVTACGWAWIGIDRAAAALDGDGNPVPRTIGQREAAGDRIWWTAWAANEVVDWRRDKNTGRLLWLMTEQAEIDSGGPTDNPTTNKVRTLYRDDGTVVAYSVAADGKIVAKSEATTSYRGVPFVQVGEARPTAHWFDQAEQIQASILNLESANHDNLIGAAFPQLVIPYGIIENLMNGAKVDYNAAINMVRGLNYPIIEPEKDKGITRYIQPSSGDLKAMPDETQRRKRELFDVCGLALSNAETRLVASAESKAWDHLDPQAVLANKATLLQEAEQKAIEISTGLDSTFPTYAPAYSKTFDIRDVKADFEALLLMNQLDLPDEGAREVRRAAVYLLEKLTPIPPDRKAAIMAEIDDMEPPDIAAAAGQGGPPAE